jgi:hypothetical protein
MERFREHEKEFKMKPFSKKKLEKIRNDDSEDNSDYGD